MNHFIAYKKAEASKWQFLGGRLFFHRNRWSDRAEAEADAAALARENPGHSFKVVAEGEPINRRQPLTPTQAKIKANPVWVGEYKKGRRYHATFSYNRGRYKFCTAYQYESGHLCGTGQSFCDEATVEKVTSQLQPLPAASPEKLRP